MKVPPYYISLILARFLAVAVTMAAVPAVAQTPFGLLAPGEGATGVQPTATLSWQPSSNATSYLVRIGTTNPPANLETVTDTSFTPFRRANGALAVNTKYYWSVTAVGPNGVQVLDSNGIQSFTVSSVPHNRHPLFTPNATFDRPSTSSAVGPWSQLTNGPPVVVTACELLTDGRVICLGVSSSNWFALTPTNTGSYVDGTWSELGSLPAGYGPFGFSSAVLPDGRVIVMGGEYNCVPVCILDRQKNGAIYDPRNNLWTSQPAPAGWSNIGDAPAVVLADGTYMQSNGTTLNAFLNANTLTWTASNGTELEPTNEEEGWVLLPDGTVLKVDTDEAGGTPKQTERYNPATDTWSSAGLTPEILPQGTEVGPGILRPDGTVFWVGAVATPTDTAHTAIYNTATNTWSAGPDVPNHDGGNDAPAALLPNGNVLVQLAPAASNSPFGSPSHFYEFDGPNLTQVASPIGCGGTCQFPSEVGGMLMLPTGQVLLTNFNSADIELYTSSGSPNPAWLPTISSVPSTLNRGGTYTVSGTQFNGFSAGASYGDDYQSATNYPLVRITNQATGHVFYAKTHDPSSMGVATGSTTVSTQFDVPVNTETGASYLEVVANGIASALSTVAISTALPPPTVTINQAQSQPDPTFTGPINFTAVFSEPVTGFSAAGVQLFGTAGATTAVVTGSGTTYNVAVSGMMQAGFVNVSINANAAVGTVSGLGNLASTSTDESVLYAKQRRGQITSQ